MDFQISDYLGEVVNKQTHRASCRSCGKLVQWKREAVASHKRGSCANVSEEEKRFFAKDINSTGSELQPTLGTENSWKEIDSAVAKFFFVTGTSLNIVESAPFKDFIESLNPAYAQRIPTASMLSEELLDQEYLKLKLRFHKALESSSDLVLVCNGWANVRGDDTVHFCVKTRGIKTLFYESINISRIKQNAAAVAESICNVIEEIGSEKFSGLITDDTKVMKAAWKIIERKYPRISANVCAAHVVKLLIKDISSFKDNLKTIEEAEKIINFVNNNHIVKAKFEEKRIEENILNKLSIDEPTRWYSFFTSGNILLKSKYILMKINDVESNLLSAVKPKAKSVEFQKLISSSDFWDRLAQYIKTIEYPSNMIEKFEADDSPLSLVYFEFGKLYQHYANNKILQELVKERFDFLFTETIGIAFMLTPKYAVEGFYFENHKEEIMGYIETFVKKRNPELAEKAREEMISFVLKISTLPENKKQIIFKMSAKQYWSVIGCREFPALNIAAKPINEMVCSSAASERISSVYKLIESSNGLSE